MKYDESEGEEGEPKLTVVVNRREYWVICDIGALIILENRRMDHCIGK